MKECLKFPSFKYSDITVDLIFIFITCYSTDLNLADTLKLYDISHKAFWAYFDTFSTAMKIGGKRASAYTKYAKNIYAKLHEDLSLVDPFNKLEVEENKTPKTRDEIIADREAKKIKRIVKLNKTETMFYNLLVQYIDSLFYTGRKLYKNSDLPVYTSNKKKEVIDKNNIDRITEISYNNDIYYKTNYIEYQLEKRFPNTQIGYYSRLTIKQLQAELNG